MTTDTTVLIIGAGAAGIAAACRLAERGMNDFVIFEAEDRIGGRICTKTFGDVPIDFGCQWVHGENGNVVFEMAKPFDMLSGSVVRLDHSLCFSDGSGQIVDAEAAFTCLGILSKIATENVMALRTFRGPATDFFLREYIKRLKDECIDIDSSALSKAFFNWSRKTQEFHEGRKEWDRPSALGSLEHWDCEGNFWLCWKQGGYNTLIDIMTKRYPDRSKELPVRSKVQLNKEVTSVQWDGEDRVVTTCADGSRYLSDHVLVTVSLGVLKSKCNTLFQPPLPAYKITAIQGLDIGTLDKIFLKFPHQWWPGEIKGFGILWTDEALQNFQFPLLHSSGSTAGSGPAADGSRRWLQDVFGFHPIDNAPNILMGWVVGHSARLMETLPLSTVMDGCMEILQYFFGALYDIPPAQQIDRSVWRTNPHFCGSGSFRSVKSDALGATAALLAHPLVDSKGKQVVMFAGEATHNHYNGSVHGAVETGFREADRLAVLCGL